MNFAPMAVNLLGFKVNLVDRSSVVTLGPNAQADILVSTKRNSGFQENGDGSPVFTPLTIVFDQDANDSNTIKGSVV